jgi:hypothetical protein
MLLIKHVAMGVKTTQHFFGGLLCDKQISILGPNYAELMKCVVYFSGLPTKLYGKLIALSEPVALECRMSDTL